MTLAGGGFAAVVRESRRVGSVGWALGMRDGVDLHRGRVRNARLQPNRQLKSQEGEEDAGQG